jgi:hypothetical protein
MAHMTQLAPAFSRRAALLGAALVVCSVWVLGACAEDDEDRIETFIAAVTGEVTTARIDHVLTTYLELAQRPVSATVMGDMRLYRAPDAQRLKVVVHGRLQRLLGTSIKILRRHVEIKGDKARVELQLFGDNVMGNVIYELSKVEKRWLISVVRVGN